MEPSISCLAQPINRLKYQKVISTIIENKQNSIFFLETASRIYCSSITLHTRLLSWIHLYSQSGLEQLKRIRKQGRADASTSSCNQRGGYRDFGWFTGWWSQVLLYCIICKQLQGHSVSTHRVIYFKIQLLKFKPNCRIIKILLKVGEFSII